MTKKTERKPRRLSVKKQAAARRADEAVRKATTVHAPDRYPTMSTGNGHARGRYPRTSTGYAKEREYVTEKNKGLRRRTDQHIRSDRAPVYQSVAIRQKRLSIAG